MKPIKAIARAQRGFSLMEIIIVVTIIGLIAAWVTSKVFGQGDRIKVKMTVSKLSELGGALDVYKLDVGKYPTQDQGLKALLTSPGVPNWSGPYVKKPDQLQDMWNNEVIYKVPGANGQPYALVSLGADGVEGGEGDNKDITSN